MLRLTRIVIFMLVTFFLAAGEAFAGTHYIAANGSDSNDGASKSTPWAHAPGMPNCASNCAAYTPAAGDQFIFRGGDTWHYGAGTPLVGGTWNWAWGGSAGSPIYVGVDSTWYVGGSWTRPILNGDNPLSTSFVSSCSTAYSTSMVTLNASYITFDNFEMKGVCWTSSAANIAGMWNIPGGTHTNIIFANNYCHGWTMTSTASDNFPCIQSFGGGIVADYWQIASNVFDGSDSPHFPIGDAIHCQYPGLSTDGCASGQGINGSHAYDVHNNVFRYLSNFIVTANCHTVHDNLFEYLYDTFASSNQQHPNVINCLGGATGEPVFFYNNIMRHTFVTEDVYLPVRTYAYIFNNVFYDNMNSVFGTLPAGCFRINAVSNSVASQTAYIYNNTLGDASCSFVFDVANAPLTAWNGTANFQNNHFIGYSSAALSSTYSCHTGSTCTILDKGNEIFQTTAVATGQGYVAANNYAPTLANNATVGAGADASSSCSTFSVDSALCSGTSGGVIEASKSGGFAATYPATTMVPRPAGKAWDVGAYYFGGASAGKPNPPAGLSATVQ